MRMLLLVALLTGLGACLAADRALPDERPSLAEHGRFVQLSVMATLTRAVGDASAPEAAASRPAPSFARYPLLVGLAAGVAVLIYGGPLCLAVRLGAVW
jgi:hypothetical protein